MPRLGAALVVLLAAVLVPSTSQEAVTAQPGSVDPPLPVERVAGVGRVETAVAASQVAWEQSATAVLARADAFPDALAGGPLAAAEGAPLLLTGGDVLHPAVADELERLATERVILLGGPAAVSEGVADDVRGLGIAVNRIAGADRYATASAVLEDAPSPEEVVLASGESFPDALAAGGLHPERILLTMPEGLPDATAQALTSATETRHVLTVGGPAVVSEATMAQAADGRSSERLAGPERYATGAAILAEAWDRLPADPRPLIVATGQAFPDALTAGPLAARLDAPILLVPTIGALPPAVKEVLAAHADRVDRLVVLGGPAAVAGITVDDVRVALNGDAPVPAELDWERCGTASFPCAWSDADPSVYERSTQLASRASAMLGDGRSREEVVGWLGADDDVLAVHDGGALLTLRLEGGLPVMVETELAAPGVEQYEPRDQSPTPTPEDAGAFRSFEPVGSPGEVKDVLIISPFHHEEWARQTALALYDVFTQPHDRRQSPSYGDVVLLTGQQADAQALNSMSQYDIIIPISHGGGGTFLGPVIARWDTDTNELVEEVLPDQHGAPGVTIATTNDGATVRLAVTPAYFRHAGITDAIVFGAFCGSSDGGLPSAVTASGSDHIGWRGSPYVGAVADATITYWREAVTAGAEVSLAYRLLQQEGLDQWLCAGQWCLDAVLLKGAYMRPSLEVDRRPRDVVEAYHADALLVPLTELQWEGTAGDGATDTLTDLSFLVEAVPRGREREAVFRLFLRGDGVPQEEIDVAFDLTSHGSPVDGTDLHQDWIVEVDRIDLGYDVTRAMIAPTPLEFEVRVGGPERYSAHRVADVRLPAGRIDVVHPDWLIPLSDGDPHPAEGTEADGTPDATTVVFEVSDVAPEEVTDFTVDAVIDPVALDGPEHIEGPLTVFDQLDERTYRYAFDVPFDEDLSSQNRAMTVDAALLKNGEEYSRHTVTVELHADTTSDCVLERSYSGTWEDEDGNVGPVSGSSSGDTAGYARPTDDAEYLERLTMGDGFGAGGVEISDVTRAIPIAQSGTFQVPYDPAGTTPGQAGNLPQGLRMNIPTGPDHRGGNYTGPGELVVTAASYDVGQLTMDAEFSGTLYQEDGSGTIEVEGSFRFQTASCWGLESDR